MSVNCRRSLSLTALPPFFERNAPRKCSAAIIDGTGTRRVPGSIFTRSTRNCPAASVIGVFAAAERPSAAERQVETHSKLFRLLRREPQHFQKLIRKVRQIPMAFRRIIRQQRINRLDLDAADAAFLHHAQLAFDLVLRNRRPEPPPTHHDPRVVRRPLKPAANIGKALS